MSIFVALLDGRKSITLSKDQRCRLSRCGRCEAMLRPAPCQEFPNQRSRAVGAPRGVQTLAEVFRDFYRHRRRK
jgi:hypothetical protein